MNGKEFTGDEIRIAPDIDFSERMAVALVEMWFDHKKRFDLTLAPDDSSDLYIQYDPSVDDFRALLIIDHADSEQELKRVELTFSEKTAILEKLDQECQREDGKTFREIWDEFHPAKEWSAKQITTEDLRRIEGQEGLILQGCGGDLREWVNGINDLLTEAGILQDGTRLKDVSVFQHEGSTNLLFSFGEDVKLDVGKLALWRIQTHNRFGGTWLSDYVSNRLGGFLQQENEQQEREKPLCPLIGQDGNIYNLLGIAANTLKENGMKAQADEMLQRVTGGDCHSYGEALCIIGEYVEITDAQDFQMQNQRKQKKEKNAHER